MFGRWAVPGNDEFRAFTHPRREQIGDGQHVRLVLVADENERRSQDAFQPVDRRRIEAFDPAGFAAGSRCLVDAASHRVGAGANARVALFRCAARPVEPVAQIDFRRKVEVTCLERRLNVGFGCVQRGGHLKAAEAGGHQDQAIDHLRVGQCKVDGDPSTE